MSQAFNFSRPLIAAVHKSEAPALVADAVGAAATSFAMNAGAANLIQSVRTACLTTEKGKARTPAVGTLAGLILAEMDNILKLAPTAGARKERDDARTPDMRQAVADQFGTIRREAFVSAVAGAAAARREAAEKRAEGKEAAAASAGAAAAASAADVASVVAGAKAVNPAELDPATALEALGTLSDSELSALASGKHAELVRRIGACFTLANAAGAGAAAAVIVKAKGQRVKAAKPADVLPLGDATPLGAMAAALTAAGADALQAAH